MESGVIPDETIPGGIDLTTTLESGQTYLWERSDGQMYREPPPTDVWYTTVLDDEVIRVREREAGLEWQGTTDVVPQLRTLLRLDDDLPAILATAPEEPLIEQALDYGSGLRIVEDPAFPTLISFICSTQMRVPRIHGMVKRLKQTYGSTYELDGNIYHGFPTPATLAGATEKELRELKLGYRAPYVSQTAELVANGTDPEQARSMTYTQARDELTQFVGVGNKVADCVLLFSLGFLQAVPLDTWIRTAIDEYFPECANGRYDATSEAIRTRFGGTYAGYVQTYVFHYLRTDSVQ